MSFGGLVLTNAGRNELIRAELGEKFSLTHIVLGEGAYSGSYTTISGLVGEVMRIPITRTSRTDEGVLLECDFSSLDAPRGFYLREIGIIANGVLCYYDNSRDDAEYIDPDANVLVKQKRMRFILMISSEIEVEVSIASSLYALAEDLERVIHPEYEEAVTLTVPEDKESIWGILGKLRRAIKEQIAHYGNYNNPHNTSKAQVGLGNADNTSDMDKPVSTAQQTAIDRAYQQATTGDTKNNTVSFTSGDSGNPTGWADVGVLVSGETHSSIFRKISLAVKNLRYLWKLIGSTSLTRIGDGTITGAISSLNTDLGGKAPTTHSHSRAQITDFPTSLPASDVYAWAKAAAKPSYSWNEISSKPGTFNPSAHTHSKSDVGLGNVDNTADENKTVATARYAVQLSHLRYIKIGNQLNGFNGTYDISFDLNTIGAAPKEHSHSYLSLDGGSVAGDVEIKGQMTIGRGGHRFKCENQQSLYIFPYETEYALFFGVWNYWTLCPSVNGNLTLGTSWTRWGQPYFTASPNINSDRNLKKDITPISDKYIDFFALLQPVTYRFKDGTSGRLHVGYISQDVEAAMEQVGLTDLDFAGFCKDKKQQEIRVKRSRSAVDANGNAVTEEYEEITWEDELDANGNPVYTYSLRYEEFIALHTAVVQRQQEKVDSLEKRLERLEQQCLQ